MSERRGELKQAYGAWKMMIAEKYLQIFLLHIGVPKFETRGWLWKTKKYFKEISDVLLEQEHWDEIVELIIGMEYWPIGHKFPVEGHVYYTKCRWSDCDDGHRAQLSVSGLKEPYPIMRKDDYIVLAEASCSSLVYYVYVFNVFGLLEKVERGVLGDARLCYNNELEGVHYVTSMFGYGFLLVADRTNNNSKLLYEGRRPDP